MRRDGGRRFGFTGGQFHDHWANDDFRQTALNVLIWVAKTEVRANGVESTANSDPLDQNRDLKEKKNKQRAVLARVRSFQPLL